MTAAATPGAAGHMDDRVEDDPRLASLPPTGPTGLTEAEAIRRRALKMGNDAVIRTGRTYFEIIRENALSPVNRGPTSWASAYWRRSGRSW